MQVAILSFKKFEKHQTPLPVEMEYPFSTSYHPRRLARRSPLIKKSFKGPGSLDPFILMHKNYGHNSLDSSKWWISYIAECSAAVSRNYSVLVVEVDVM